LVADPAVRLTQPQDATVVIEIWPAPVEREIAGVPIRPRNLGPGLRAQVSPPTTRVVVRGRRDALSDLKADDVDAFVDLAGLPAGRYNLRIQVDPSENIGVGEVMPAVVEVTIR
jgi:YbbR domain-containing protein